MDKPPHLTLVDPNAVTAEDLEFAPLPFYPFDERPQTFPVEQDEAATAIHIANGDVSEAAALLKIPTIRLQRLIRQSPRLERVQSEAYGVTLAKAASVPIRTLFDPTADQRAREWASTKVLQSKLAQGHPLSPAPPGAQAASLTLNQPQRTITFRWRTPDDPDPNDPIDGAA
jgi:hypothetical protein